MKQLTFELTGIYSLLQNNPASMQKKGGPMGPKVIPTPEDEAESKAYRMASGQLYIRATAFRNAIVEGVTDLKIGKKAATGIFKRCLFAFDDVTPLYHPKTLEPIRGYEINQQRVVVQKQGVTRARPEILEWGCRVTLDYNDDLLTPESILKGAEIAGDRVGLGDFRPSKSGPHGRFTVRLLA